MYSQRTQYAIAAALVLAPVAQAQTTTQKPPASTGASVELAPVVVTANPLGSELFELAPPISVLDGADLLLRRRSTLGETLNGLPGVSSTQFGPNASRPVIRGLDGDRIRILNNGSAVLDASSLSFDHDVAADSLVFERAEVVRGPAALVLWRQRSRRRGESDRQPHSTGPVPGHRRPRRSALRRCGSREIGRGRVRGR